MFKISELKPESNGFEPAIVIKLVENGYIVIADTPARDANDNIVIESKVHIFPRDVHVLKFIRDLLPTLESLPK